MKTLAVFILAVAVCIGFITMFNMIQGLVGVVAIQQNIISMHTDMISEIYDGVGMITGHLDLMEVEISRW